MLSPGKDHVEAHPSFFKLSPPPEVLARQKQPAVSQSPRVVAPSEAPRPTSIPQVVATSEVPRPTGFVTPSPAGYSKTASLLRQLEYYFCDENLSKDKFFSQKIAEGEGGMVSFEVVHSCPRLERLRIDRKELVAIARRSKELLVSEDGSQVSYTFPERHACALH